MVLLLRRNAKRLSGFLACRPKYTRKPNAAMTKPEIANFLPVEIKIHSHAVIEPITGSGYNHILKGNIIPCFFLLSFTRPTA